MCPEDADGPRPATPAGDRARVADGEPHPMHLRPYEALRTSGTAAADREGFQARGRVWHARTRNERARSRRRAGNPRFFAAARRRRRRVDDPRAPTPRSAGRRDATGRRSPGSIVSRRMPPLNGCLSRGRRASRERGGGAERRGGSRDTAAQVAPADATARGATGGKRMFYSLLRKSRRRRRRGLKSPSGRRRQRGETAENAETAEDAAAATDETAETAEENVISPVRFHPLSLRSTQTRPARTDVQSLTSRSPRTRRRPEDADEPAIIAKDAADAAVNAGARIVEERGRRGVRVVRSRRRQTPTRRSRGSGGNGDGD